MAIDAAWLCEGQKMHIRTPVRTPPWCAKSRFSKSSNFFTKAHGLTKTEFFAFYS